MSLTEKAVLIYLLVMSLAALVLYGADKLKAKAHGWRIPERILLLTSLLGGAPGGLLAMQLFRHKTRHWYFYAVNILSLGLWGYLLYRIFMR